jgi:hypothetical protein
VPVFSIFLNYFYSNIHVQEVSQASFVNVTLKRSHMIGLVRLFVVVAHGIAILVSRTHANSFRTSLYMLLILPHSMQLAVPCILFFNG